MKTEQERVHRIEWLKEEMNKIEVRWPETQVKNEVLDKLKYEKESLEEDLIQLKKLTNRLTPWKSPQVYTKKI